MRASPARLLRKAAIAATGWFVSGYLLSWTAFSIVASIAQGALERVAWLTPMMAAASNKAGGGVLLAAGVYQFTPVKGHLSQSYAKRRLPSFRSTEDSSAGWVLPFGLECATVFTASAAAGP